MFGCGGGWHLVVTSGRQKAEVGGEVLRTAEEGE